MTSHSNVTLVVFVHKHWTPHTYDSALAVLLCWDGFCSL